MGRTATKEQEARVRARAARVALLVERNAQDERIEEAVAAVLLAWAERTAAAGQLEQAERAAVAALRRLGQERVPVRDMAALTGIGQSVCARLLRLPVAGEPGPPGRAAGGSGSGNDAVG